MCSSVQPGDTHIRGPRGWCGCAVLVAAIVVGGGSTVAQERPVSLPGAVESFPVQQASRTMNEPAHFVGASGEKQLLLSPPKRDGSTEKTSGGSRMLGAVVSVVASLAVVLGLFLVVAWIMRRGMPGSARRLPSEVVDILGRAPLAGRQQMHLLRFGNKLLLVCASATGVDAIGEITDPLEIDRLAGLCAAQETTSASSSFKQIFGQLAREKISSGTASANTTSIPRRNSLIAGERADA